MPQLGALSALRPFSAGQMEATMTRTRSRTVRIRRRFRVVTETSKNTFLFWRQLRLIVQSNVFESFLFRGFRPFQLTRASQCRSCGTIRSRIKALPRGSGSVRTYWGTSRNVLPNRLSKHMKLLRGPLTNDLRYDSNDSRDIENGSFSLSMLR